MIKNNIQLRRAKARYQRVCQQLAGLGERFSGTELEIFGTGLAEEVRELEDEIAEYEELRALNLGEAIQGPLSKPALLENVGELLAKLRIAADFTQSELAARLGWQQPNLSRFESENYNSQTIAKVVEYASVLGVWLHVAPSLTEEVTEIRYRGEIVPEIAGYSLSTSGSVLETAPMGEVAEDSSGVSWKGEEGLCADLFCHEPELQRQSV
jgi:transcriptional regulator with XRE-family HTH domain